MVARRELVRSAGLEPATPGFEGRCSIQLSYERTLGDCAPERVGLKGDHAAEWRDWSSERQIGLDKRYQLDPPGETKHNASQNRCNYWLHPVRDAQVKTVPPIAVITADVVGSSKYSSGDRSRLDGILRAAFRETEQRFPRAFHTGLAFRVTAGDEFQCVLAEVPQVLSVLTYLRAVAATAKLEPPIKFRASIGIGTLSTPKRSNPYEQDGVAFVRARNGLERLSKGRSSTRSTALVTGHKATDTAAVAVLSLADYIMEGWTIPQWEAVRWALLGLKRHEVAVKLRIAHQNVTKRLLAAGWPQIDVAFASMADLLDLLDKPVSTQQAMQSRIAP